MFALKAQLRTISSRRGQYFTLGVSPRKIEDFVGFIVSGCSGLQNAQPAAMTSQAISCSITTAIMGVISIIPSLGTIRRNGARIGSVISFRKRIGWLYGFGATQDRMARAIMAKLSTWQKILIKVRAISMLLVV